MIYYYYFLVSNTCCYISYYCCFTLFSIIFLIIIFIIIIITFTSLILTRLETGELVELFLEREPDLLLNAVVPETEDNILLAVARLKKNSHIMRKILEKMPELIDSTNKFGTCQKEEKEKEKEG